jgi:hypothetical protein
MLLEGTRVTNVEGAPGRSVGSMVVGTYVECLHPSQLIPFLLVILVSFYVFPVSRTGRQLYLDNLVDHVIFRTECRACKYRLCSKSLCDVLD